MNWPSFCDTKFQFQSFPIINKKIFNCSEACVGVKIYEGASISIKLVAIQIPSTSKKLSHTLDQKSQTIEIFEAESKHEIVSSTCEAAMNGLTKGGGGGAE